MSFMPYKDGTDSTGHSIRRRKERRMSELKPCPFCSNSVHIHSGYNNMNFITCGQKDDGSDGCGAVVSFRPDLRGEKLRTSWNKRTEAGK